MARQASHFHKCHRCIYRGQASTWEPANPPLAMLDMHTAESRNDIEVKTVEIARPAKKGGKPAPAKAGKAAEAAS